MSDFDMSIFDDAPKHRVDEFTIKDFLRVISPTDLPHRDWAPLIKLVKFKEMRKDTMKFFVPNEYNGWNVYVQFVDYYEQIKDTSMNAMEVAQILIYGSNLRWHCTCPSFIFWGYEYILTQLDAAIIPEDRFPHIRNPHLKGILCKHCRKTAVVLSAHIGDLAAQVKIDRQNM